MLIWCKFELKKCFKTMICVPVKVNMLSLGLILKQILLYSFIFTLMWILKCDIFLLTIKIKT